MDNTSSLKTFILKQIVEQKIKLEGLVGLNGLTSPMVLDCSQRLDQLIYQIQLLELQPSISNEENES